MSQGEFTKTKYEDRNGRIYNIKVQPETLAFTDGTLTNAATANAVDQPISAYARGSRRRNGVTARKVAVEFTGALPDGYSGDPVSIPILQPALFDAVSPGSTGTYLGSPVRVISKTGEQLR